MPTPENPKPSTYPTIKCWQLCLILPDTGYTIGKEEQKSDFNPLLTFPFAHLNITSL